MSGFRRVLFLTVLLILPGLGLVSAAYGQTRPLINGIAVQRFYDDFSDQASTNAKWLSEGNQYVFAGRGQIMLQGSPSGSANITTKGYFHHGTLIFNLSLPSSGASMVIFGYGKSSQGVLVPKTLPTAYFAYSVQGTSSILRGLTSSSMGCTSGTCQQFLGFILPTNGFMLYGLSWSSSNLGFNILDQSAVSFAYGNDPRTLLGNLRTNPPMSVPGLEEQAFNIFIGLTGLGTVRVAWVLLGDQASTSYASVTATTIRVTEFTTIPSSVTRTYSTDEVVHFVTTLTTATPYLTQNQLVVWISMFSSSLGSSVGIALYLLKSKRKAEGNQKR